MDFLLGPLLATSVPSEPDPETEFVDQIALFAALLCGCIVLGHLLENSRWLNQSITALLIGLVTGCVILLTSGGTSSRILEFKQEFFFIYLLPPIIFNAGFQVKKKQFFRNFMTITLFGVIGTLISFAIISFGAKLLFPKLDIGYFEIKDYLALGAIFSATDSVCTLQVLNQDETPLLYSLVFGEGVVNDATSVVLYNAITNFDLSDTNLNTALEFAGNFFSLFVLSTLLGVFVGLLCAFIIRTLYFGRHSTDREVALMILMAYLSYITAEVFELSGILTVFFCGIVMSHYAWHNVTHKSQVTTKHSFATMSYISEVFIFLYVGMDSLDVEKWRLVNDSPEKLAWVSVILFGLIMAGRAAFVLPLSFLSNLTRKGSDEKVGFKQQFVVWWAGLMRGAVSVALSYKKFTGSGQTMQPVNALLITSTISIVLFSTVVFGLLTKPIIRKLLPHSEETEPLSPNSSRLPLLGNGYDHDHNHNHDTEKVNRASLTTSSLKMLLNSPSNTIHHYWRKFDDVVMRPVFGGRGFVSYATGTRDMDVIH
uniref:Sodium/hydrogen exchanger n=1 Tax=Karelinia caspia TaxID=313960 RepID=Q2PT60_9ASTR|nr:Na+/H+ antiporter Nhx1 [Karelinia caspia]